MGLYEIQKQLRSSSYFPQPVSVGGLRLQSSGLDNEQSLIASGTQEDSNYKAASAQFDQRLLQVQDALCISRMVAISSYGASSFAHREDRREALLVRVSIEPDVIMFHALDTVATDEFTTADAQLSESNDDIRGAVRHYRESLLYPSALVATMHLLRAAEALAGQVRPGQVCPHCHVEPLRCEYCRKEVVSPRTSTAELRRLVGDEAYDYFYRNPGIRNDIMHGRLVEQEPLIRSNEPIRTNVRARLRELLGLSPNLPLARDRALVRITPHPNWLEANEWPDLSTLIAMDERGELNWYSDPRVVDRERVLKLREEY